MPRSYVADTGALKEASHLRTCDTAIRMVIISTGNSIFHIDSNTESNRMRVVVPIFEVSHACRPETVLLRHTGQH